MRIGWVVAGVAMWSGLAVAPVMAGQFSAIYAFGDSLSDAGNAYIASGGTTPPVPPYGMVNGYGVFSNGPVWVQTLSANLGLGSLRPSLAGGSDFAVGGASSGPFGLYPGSAGDLLPAAGLPFASSQLGMFEATVPHPAANALYTLSIGGNDLQFIFAHDAGNPAQAQADADSVIGNVLNFVSGLAAQGAKNFIVLNVPDLGLTPAIRAEGPGAAAAASAFTAGFDQAFQQALDTLAASEGLDLSLLDTYSLIDAAVADPTQFGLSNVTEPCIDAATGSVCANPDQYLFWDDVHPTETGHFLLAQLAAAVVPEPGSLELLAGGLILLGALSRRMRLRGPVQPEGKTGCVAENVAGLASARS